MLTSASAVAAICSVEFNGTITLGVPGDHVRRVVALWSIDLLGRVLAIEILTSARALDLRAPLDSSPAIAAVRERIRADVPGPGPDRHLAPEIEACVRLVAGGERLAAANLK